MFYPINLLFHSRGEEIDLNPKSIFGISFQGSICHPDPYQRILILQWQTNKNFKENAYILAHELGHSLGIEHDFYLDNRSGNKIFRYRQVQIMYTSQLMLKSKVNFKTNFLLAQSAIISDQTMISIHQTIFFLQFTYLHMIWPIVQMKIFVQTLVESWIIMSIILKEFGPNVVQKISRYLLMKKLNTMEIFVQIIMHVMIHF